MQGVGGENECGPLFGIEAAFHQRQIRILVTAINLVADDRVSCMRQMNADLVFAAGVRLDTEQAEWCVTLPEPAQYLEAGLCGSAVSTHTVPDRDAAAFILAQGRIDRAAIRVGMTMHDGEILFADPALCPDLAKFARGGVGFGHQCQAAGLAVQTVDEVWTCISAQMQSHTADEAGEFAILARVADQISRLVDHQQFVIFVDDWKKGAQWRSLITGQTAVDGPDDEKKAAASAAAFS